jgi:hypothetical protein
LVVAGGVLTVLAAGAVGAFQVFRADHGGPAIVGGPEHESFPPVLPPTFTPESVAPSSAQPVPPAPARASGSASATPGPTSGSAVAAQKTGPITGYSACAAGKAVTFTATFTTTYEFRHVFIDADADAATGHQAGEVAGGFGADYMIENDALYRASKADGSWQQVKGASPLLSASGGTYRWQVRSNYGGRRVVFNAVTGSGAEVSTGVVPVNEC